ncbi:hypothetical protein [Frateuria aurantia]|uniref:Lipoprotein n=1 Tax=Frateuria aurantia (strain ATCC 33424 / DSM 6220 / KCTC 2777 / LMG 1558 / NBRC 3245 / NCIMB 13370) TaxID=767434 RepID=H8L249_FRAAD|nr:hypothetical protein [Frateuria aurantia]AFC87557.1 hypothetical protein Fraau_3234 [Frateuria aurantia DSM 6220]
MSKGFLRAWLLAAVLMLAACHHAAPGESAPPGGASPTEAAQLLVDRLKHDDFIGYWRQGLPADDFKTMQSDWALSRQMPSTLKPADRERMNAWLAQFDAPHAQSTLQAEWLPKLAGYQRQYADQLPMLMSVMQMVAGTAIDQSASLTTSEKAPLHDIVGAVGPWAAKAPWFDPAKARQGIAIAVATVQGLGIKDVQVLGSLDFDQAMIRYAAFFKGLKQLLALYGLDIDASLDSVHVSASPVDADHAQLKIDYVLLGHPMSITTTAVRIEQRWFVLNLIDTVHEAHQRLQASPADADSIGPAPTGTTGAAAVAASAATPASSASSHR